MSGRWGVRRVAYVNIQRVVAWAWGGIGGRAFGFEAECIDGSGGWVNARVGSYVGGQMLMGENGVNVWTGVWLSRTCARIYALHLAFGAGQVESCLLICHGECDSEYERAKLIDFDSF